MAGRLWADRMRETRNSELRLLAAAARRLGSVTLLGVLPVALSIALLAASYGSNKFLYDYHGDLFNAGQAIAAGHDPYEPSLLARKAAETRAGRVPDSRFAVPIYPAPA